MSHDSQETEPGSKLPGATQLAPCGGPSAIRAIFFLIVVKLDMMFRHFSHLEVYHSVAHIHSQRQLTVSTAWTSDVRWPLP